MRKGGSKIPEDLWESVYAWHCQGISASKISTKLMAEHQLKVERKAIEALIHNLREERNKRTASILAQQAVSSTEKDYKDLQSMEDRLERVASIALDDFGPKYDPYLFLKVVDRQTRIKAMKLGLSAGKSSELDPVQHRNEMLDSLLSRFGTRRD